MNLKKIITLGMMFLTFSTFVQASQDERNRRVIDSMRGMPKAAQVEIVDETKKRLIEYHGINVSEIPTRNEISGLKVPQYYAPDFDGNGVNAHIKVRQEGNQLYFTNTGKEKMNQVVALLKVVGEDGKERYHKTGPLSFDQAYVIQINNKDALSAQNYRVMGLFGAQNGEPRHIIFPISYMDRADIPVDRDVNVIDITDGLEEVIRPKEVPKEIPKPVPKNGHKPVPKKEIVVQQYTNNTQVNIALANAKQGISDLGDGVKIYKDERFTIVKTPKSGPNPIDVLMAIGSAINISGGSVTHSNNFNGSSSGTMGRNMSSNGSSNSSMFTGPCNGVVFSGNYSNSLSDFVKYSNVTSSSSRSKVSYRGFSFNGATMGQVYFALRALGGNNKAKVVVYDRWAQAKGNSSGTNGMSGLSDARYNNGSDAHSYGSYKTVNPKNGGNYNREEALAAINSRRKNYNTQVKARKSPKRFGRN